MKEEIYKGVVLSSFEYEENRFINGGEVWSVLKLHKAAEGLPEFDVPLASINISSNPWSNDMSLADMLHHYKRIEEADMSFPIIYNNEGIIADGWHRVCKAILLGKRFIKGVRLEKMPTPDSEA